MATSAKLRYGQIGIRSDKIRQGLGQKGSDRGQNRWDQIRVKSDGVRSHKVRSDGVRLYVVRSYGVRWSCVRRSCVRQVYDNNKKNNNCQFISFLLIIIITSYQVMSYPGPVTSLNLWFVSFMKKNECYLSLMLDSFSCMENICKTTKRIECKALLVIGSLMPHLKGFWKGWQSIGSKWSIPYGTLIESQENLSRTNVSQSYRTLRNFFIFTDWANLKNLKR